MSLPAAVRFLFGDARAIREVANNRSTLWTGIALVLLTGIARNYDQNYFLESPFWLAGPLVFSFFSGSFLYWILIRGFARRHFPENARQEKQWRTFIALFWMTAPIAWLYAIPVERFLEPYRAAQANLSLLAIVSIWRVLLMSRILAVLFEISFFRMLGWVLAAASLEIILVIFFGAFGSGQFSQRIFAAMAGMRNSPESALLISALGYAWGYSWAVLLLCIVILAAYPFRGTISPLPAPSSGTVPWFSVGTLIMLWSLIAIRPQIEQHRYVRHAALVEEEKYAQGLTYLQQYQKEDFPAARRLKPDPYEFRVWQDLPPTIALVTSNTPLWIRQVYLADLATTLSHHFSSYHSLSNVTAMYSALEKLPEGRPWLLSNQLDLARQGVGSLPEIQSSKTNEPNVLNNLLDILRRMGMAETNLARLAKDH